MARGPISGMYSHMKRVMSLIRQTGTLHVIVIINIRYIFYFDISFCCRYVVNIKYFSCNFKTDVEMIKAMGIRNYRFSISWSRVLSDGTMGKYSESDLHHLLFSFGTSNQNSSLSFVLYGTKIA